MSVVKNEMAPRINVNSLRNIEEMKEAFNQLCSEEARVSSEHSILGNQVESGESLKSGEVCSDAE